MNIKSKIHTIRGIQVMLDSDLAELYGISTKILNQATKRNIERFPQTFMFQLTEYEYNSLRFQNGTLSYETPERQILRSQFVTSSGEALKPSFTAFKDEILKPKNDPTDWGTHRKYLPYAFTEQGVAMLSAVLRSKTAVNISIQIIETFVAQRRFLSSNNIFQRLNNIELKQINYDKQFEQIFDAIEDKTLQRQQGIFFDNQIFDAYKFISDLIRTSKSSIILIDNYIDDSVLTLFNKRNKNVQVIIYTKEITKQLQLDLNKYNSQYPFIKIKEFQQSHDRFLIIDNKEVYHFGASLKDLGKKWFAFSKFDKEALKILEKLSSDC